MKTQPKFVPHGNVPWMNQSTWNWFRKKGLIVDCESKKVYFDLNGRNEIGKSWVSPVKGWNDRFALLSEVTRLLSLIRLQVDIDQGFIHVFS